MTPQEALAQIRAACPGLSADDAQGILDATDEERQDLVRDYVDALKTPPPDPLAEMVRICGVIGQIVSALVPVVGDADKVVSAIKGAAAK